MDLNNFTDWQKLGGAAFVLIPFLGYQIWKILKEDRKGNTIDARIDAYSVTLQATIDKLVKKLEDLGAMKDKLVADNAMFSAQLVVMKKELEDAKEEIDTHIARIKYLEKLLQDNKVAFNA